MPRKRKSSSNATSPPATSEVAEAIAEASEAQVVRLAQNHTADAVHALVEIATNTKRKREPNENEYFEMELDSDGDPITLDHPSGSRSSAANKLLEYGHGRPANSQTGQIGGEGGGIKVVIQQFLADGTRQEIDVTPVREQIEAHGG